VDAWESLTTKFNTAYMTIDEAVTRIEKVADQIARTLESAAIQKLLSGINLQEEASFPCNNLPVAENYQFFGRKDILQEIDAHLMPTQPANRITSVAIHGLGGVGKTQIALAYAYQMLEDLDAVLWISAEDAFSVVQSFSRIALHTLKLEEAQPQAYQQNMALVLEWLRQTSKALPPY
jgi:DNA replication protein DnaC